MRILCFGDSNTYGYDPRSYFGDRYPTEDRWVDIFKKNTGWEVRNAGVNGREIPHSPGEFRMLFPHTGVDSIIIMLGTNDLLQGASASEAAARMEAFLKHLLPHCKSLLLVAPPPMKRGAWVPSNELAAESIRLAEEYHALAQKLHIPFIDTRRWNIDLAFDGVHFTEEGHRRFAEQLTKYLPQFFQEGTGMGQ